MRRRAEIHKLIVNYEEMKKNHRRDLQNMKMKGPLFDYVDAVTNVTETLVAALIQERKETGRKK